MQGPVKKAGNKGKQKAVYVMVSGRRKYTAGTERGWRPLPLNEQGWWFHSEKRHHRHLMGWDLPNNSEEAQGYTGIKWHGGQDGEEGMRADQAGKSHCGVDHKGLGFYSVGKSAIGIETEVHYLASILTAVSSISLSMLICLSCLPTDTRPGGDTGKDSCEEDSRNVSYR